MTRFLLILLTAFALLSCGGPNGVSQLPAFITSVDWAAQNVDASYWNDGRSTRMFYRFAIRYSGTITTDNIDYARVYLPDGNHYWTIYDKTRTELLDTANKVVGVGGYWSLGNKIAHQDQSLPVGLLKAEIAFKNGVRHSLTFQTTVPGGTSNEGWEFIVSEDEPSPEMSWARTQPALERPTGIALTANNNASTVNVQFRLNDRRVAEASVAFVDDEGKYAGSYRLTAAQNSGLNKQGVNLLTIRMADIDLDGEESTVDTVDDLKLHLAACFVAAANGNHSALSTRAFLP